MHAAILSTQDYTDIVAEKKKKDRQKERQREKKRIN